MIIPVNVKDLEGAVGKAVQIGDEKGFYDGDNTFSLIPEHLKSNAREHILVTFDDKGMVWERVINIGPQGEIGSALKGRSVFGLSNGPLQPYRLQRLQMYAERRGELA